MSNVKYMFHEIMNPKTISFGKKHLILQKVRSFQTIWIFDKVESYVYKVNTRNICIKTLSQLKKNVRKPK